MRLDLLCLTLALIHALRSRFNDEMTLSDDSEIAKRVSLDEGLYQAILEYLEVETAGEDGCLPPFSILVEYCNRVRCRSSLQGLEIAPTHSGNPVQSCSLYIASKTPPESRLHFEQLPFPSTSR